jgi:hypothetical protein
MRPRFLLLLACLLWLTTPARACELCAIYNANSVSGQSSGGWLLSLSEQFIPFRTLQFEGNEFSMKNPDYLDSSITHVVPTYNFSARFGLSLNVPVVYRSFKRTELRYSTSGPSQLVVDKGDELNLGDLALIARWTAWEKSEMEYGFFLNLLGGVKFPTGKTDRIEDEVEQARIFESLLPPGTPHDPLGHSISGVHQHEISPGSGSFDGVFGATLNARWRRLFFNSQIQYYLRTQGADTFEYGDELIVSGGPGGYVLLADKFTLSLQAVAVYDTLARAELLGRLSDRTGMTAWYMGPLVTATWGERFSTNAGADLPLRIANNGFQNVPNFQFHAGISYRF